MLRIVVIRSYAMSASVSSCGRPEEIAGHGRGPLGRRDDPLRQTVESGVVQFPVWSWLWQSSTVTS
jgi:hypothetical protein